MRMPWGWRCRRGLQHCGSNWNRRMSTSTRPAWAATLSDEPPEAVWEEMNGWVASISKQWIKVAEQRRKRGGKMLSTSMQQDDVWQNARQVKQNSWRFRELSNPADFWTWSRYCCIKYISRFTRTTTVKKNWKEKSIYFFLLAVAQCQILLVW